MPQTYALAHRLIGFTCSTLRVRVIEQRDGCAWVLTADLSDAGTPLVLNAGQVELLDESTPALAGWQHVAGLVVIGGAA